MRVESEGRDWRLSQPSTLNHSGRLDSNQRSRAPEARGMARLPHVPLVVDDSSPKKRPAGFEPAHPPWRGGTLPLRHGRLVVRRIVKEPRAPGRTRTGVAALRRRSRRRWTTSAWMPNPPPSGTGGARTLTVRVRTGCAVANTSIPLPFDHEAGGTRTPARLGKSQGCCRYTTTSQRSRCGVCRVPSVPSLFPVCGTDPVARGGVEPPPPPYQSDMLPLHHRAACSRDGGTRTHALRGPRPRGLPLPYIPSRTVGTAGVEPAFSRPPTGRDAPSPRSDPKSLPSSPYGSRTHLAAVKERHPVPIDERADDC